MVTMTNALTALNPWYGLSAAARRPGARGYASVEKNMNHKTSDRVLQIRESALRRIIQEEVSRIFAAGRSLTSDGPTANAADAAPIPGSDAAIEIRVLGPRLVIVRNGVEVAFARRPHKALAMLAALVLMPLRAGLGGHAGDPLWPQIGLEALIATLEGARTRDDGGATSVDPSMLAAYEHRLFYLRETLCAREAIRRADGHLALTAACKVDLWTRLGCSPAVAQARAEVPPTSEQIAQMLVRERWGHSPWMESCRAALRRRVSATPDRSR